MIWEQRNADFCNAQTDAQMAYIEAEREVDRLQTENAKLRELVCMMLRVAGVAEYATDSEWQVVTDYLRELGIEVDE